MVNHQLGDTVAILTTLLGDKRPTRYEGEVIAVAAGRVTMEIPNDDELPNLAISAPAEEFTHVKPRADVWVVAKVEHDENELVTPNIIGDWIFRSAGQSGVEHTRKYAAQLLAAADKLERHQAAEAVSAR